jgi:hypothetical protein
VQDNISISGIYDSFLIKSARCFDSYSYTASSLRQSVKTEPTTQLTKPHEAL